MAQLHHHDFKLFESTPWGVPVIDVQPLTLTVESWSSDPSCAENALSYTGEEGAELATQVLDSNRVVQTSLRIPIDGTLTDGVVLRPRGMEEKWGLYLHARRLLFVRSWKRRVVVQADVNVMDGVAVIGPVRAAFTNDNETPEFTARMLEYIVRDIALGEGLPTPLPAPFTDYAEAAIYCFALFGPKARFATHLPAQLPPPSRPLCTFTRIHIAVAREEVDRIASLVAEGVPVGARGPDGAAAIHWATGCDSIKVVVALLDAGTPADLPTREGATAMMLAVQNDRGDLVRLLLSRGADVNAVDHRGFTSLHRAAEMGRLELVQVLLEAGAVARAAEKGQTPLGLAKGRQENAIVAMLERAGHS